MASVCSPFYAEVLLTYISRTIFLFSNLLLCLRPILAHVSAASEIKQFFMLQLDVQRLGKCTENLVLLGDSLGERHTLVTNGVPLQVRTRTPKPCAPTIPRLGWLHLCACIEEILLFRKGRRPDTSRSTIDIFLHTGSFVATAMASYRSALFLFFFTPKL